MDLLDHLVEEHREAEGLIAQLADTEPGTRRNQLIDQLIDALHVHMEVEEQFLYPITVEVIGAEEAEEGNNEHDLARQGLDQLRRLRDEPGWAAALDVVKAAIDHHVEDEEQEMFPKLRAEAGDRIAGLDPDQLEATIDLTKDQLYRQAREAGIEGRSAMTRDELARALAGQSD